MHCPDVPQPPGTSRPCGLHFSLAQWTPIPPVSFHPGSPFLRSFFPSSLTTAPLVLSETVHSCLGALCSPFSGMFITPTSLTLYGTLACQWAEFAYQSSPLHCPCPWIMTIGSRRQDCFAIPSTWYSSWNILICSQYSLSLCVNSRAPLPWSLLQNKNQTTPLPSLTSRRVSTPLKEAALLYSEDKMWILVVTWVPRPTLGIVFLTYSVRVKVLMFCPHKSLAAFNGKIPITQRTKSRRDQWVGGVGSMLMLWGFHSYHPLLETLLSWVVHVVGLRDR